MEGYMKTQIKVKKIVGAVMALSIFLLGVGCGILGGTEPQNNAEVNAVEFMKGKFEGDAKKCVDLMLDELVTAVIDEGGYETENVLVYALEKQLACSIEDYKDEYGKKWEYEISIIDSYKIAALEGFEEYECVEVVLNIQHDGRKLLFFKSEGSEEVKIQMMKRNDSWYVWGASFVLI
jgi:hypothetical protein